MLTIFIPRLASFSLHRRVELPNCRLVSDSQIISNRCARVRYAATRRLRRFETEWWKVFGCVKAFRWSISPVADLVTTRPRFRSGQARLLAGSNTVYIRLIVLCLCGSMRGVAGGCGIRQNHFSSQVHSTVLCHLSGFQARAPSALSSLLAISCHGNAPCSIPLHAFPHSRSVPRRASSNARTSSYGDLPRRTAAVRKVVCILMAGRRRRAAVSN